ncbi:MAG: DUF935 domain-containing protein [Opitutales bacterium]|nr:DUF935 domain-containing protein [Opitutales bacterium]
MQTNIYTTSIRTERFSAQSWNPIRSLTPQSLSKILDDFHAGHLKQAAMIWDAIEQRDDVLQGAISKRKKSIARLDWEILTLDSSDEAMRQKAILEQFYNNLSCVNAFDENEHGGLSLLIHQMMDAVGKRYAVHEVVFKPFKQDNTALLTAEFRFVPLFFFENEGGRLQFVDPETHKKVPTTSGEWLVTTGDGLMESSSIAYLFKHLSLRDWLIYCERNGMPGVKGVTQARPGSKEWDMACDAVKNFSAEFCAVMSHGTDIQAIDISGKGVLPYPEFVKRIDDLMYLTWLGTRLINSSKENPTGVTLQRNENNILEEEDAQRISETLNEQVDREVLLRLEGIKQPKAYFRLKSSSNKNLNNDLAIIKTLYDMGVSLSVNDIREHFGINPPLDVKDTLQKWGVHPVAESEESLQK